MKWTSSLIGSVATFFSAIGVIFLQLQIESISKGVIELFSFEIEQSVQVETSIRAFFQALIFFIIMSLFNIFMNFFKVLSGKVVVDFEFLNNLEENISVIEFGRNEDGEFESRDVKIKFKVLPIALPLRIIKLLKGDLRLSFNPEIINFELKHGVLNDYEEGAFCYRQGTRLHFDLFSLYNPSKKEICKSVEIVISPLSEAKGNIHICIIPRKNKSWWGGVWYLIRWLVLIMCVKIMQRNLALNS